MEDFPNFDIDLDCTDSELIACADKVEKGGKTSGVQSRFVTLEQKDLIEIISDAQAKSTKKATKWIVKTLEGK